MSSLRLALFLYIILFEKPKTVIEKFNLVENVVSPPQSKIPYFFCSSDKDSEISMRFFFEKCFLFPPQR